MQLKNNYLALQKQIFFLQDASSVYMKKIWPICWRNGTDCSYLENRKKPWLLASGQLYFLSFKVMLQFIYMLKYRSGKKLLGLQCGIHTKIKHITWKKDYTFFFFFFPHFITAARKILKPTCTGLRITSAHIHHFDTLARWEENTLKLKVLPKMNTQNKTIFRGNHKNHTKSRSYYLTF